ncbi:MAG TPA: hypothetical protein VIM60_10385 [Edaphobacter sp.]
MNQGNWIALLGIVVALLGICVPVLVTLILRGKDAHKAELAQRDAVITKQDEIIERQRDSIVDYKIALGQLTGTTESVNRLLRSLPIPQPQDGTGS